MERATQLMIQQIRSVTNFTEFELNIIQRRCERLYVLSGTDTLYWLGLVFAWVQQGKDIGTFFEDEEEQFGVSRWTKKRC